jgi:hypothetical protein
VKPLKSFLSIASSTFCMANFSSCSSTSTKVENSLNTNKDNERNRIPFYPKTNSISFIAKNFIFFRYFTNASPTGRHSGLAFKRGRSNCSSVIYHPDLKSGSESLRMCLLQLIFRNYVCFEEGGYECKRFRISNRITFFSVQFI